MGERYLKLWGSTLVMSETINQNLNKRDVEISLLKENFFKKSCEELKEAGHEGLCLAIENIVEEAVARERENGILNTAGCLLT